MPELPEVESARRLLTAWTVGRRIREVDVRDARLALSAAEARALVGHAITAWTRRGKQLLATLDDGTHGLAVHLGMTGRFVADPDSERRHQRLLLSFAKAVRKPTSVALVDPRRWAEVAFVALASDPFAKLGPDALAVVNDVHTSGEALRAALVGARPSASALLKDRLVDQARLAGLGNIAASEICFRARLSPYAKVATLRPAAWAELARAIQEHLAATLAALASETDIAYLSDGAANPFLVYGREAEPCPHCRTPIVRTVHAGRATFHCPKCQPEPR